jgi:hypothetical protein
MITVYPNLRQRMEELGVTDRELANWLNMSRIVLQLKMWGIKGWTLTDAVRLCAFFRTPDVEHLFVRNHSKQQ